MVTQQCDDSGAWTPMVHTNPPRDDKEKTVRRTNSQITTISRTGVKSLLGPRKTGIMYASLVLAFVALAAAHPGYRDMIPNGYSVPNPCGSDMWQAVGHYDPFHHTIAKNQFGKERYNTTNGPTFYFVDHTVGKNGNLRYVKYRIAKKRSIKDFSAAAHIWTETLCKTDSDGDGRTNGEELGDPTCQWNIGDTPSGSASGHPGICEPIGSVACSNQAFRCGCHGNQCVGR